MYMSHYTSLHHLIRQIIYEYFSHYLQGALLSTLSARAKSNTCAATKANSDVKSDCRFGSWASAGDGLTGNRSPGLETPSLILHAEPSAIEPHDLACAAVAIRYSEVE